MKVALVYSAQRDDDLSVSKGDTVQILDVGSHNVYQVKQETGLEGWLPAYVIGQRDHEDSSSR